MDFLALGVRDTEMFYFQYAGHNITCIMGIALSTETT